MDTLLLARLQFAITTVYHFFFVPLTLGLSILVAILETTYEDNRVVNQINIGGHQSECDLSNNWSADHISITGCTWPKVYLPIVLRNYPALPVEIKFSSSAYRAWENAGVATVTVELSRPSVETVTVDLATTSGTATPRVDYEPVVTTLVFTPSRTSVNGPIRIFTDTIAESPETVVLTLSRPVNAVLGQPNPATLTIVDICPPTPPNCAPAVWCTIPSEFGPVGMAYDTADGLLFVANQGEGSHPGNLTIFTSSGIPLQTLDLSNAQGVALDSTRGRNRAYVVGGNLLYVVNVSGTTPSVLAMVYVGIGEDVGAYSVAYNPNTDLIYVTSYRDNSVTVISGATLTVLSRMAGFYEPSYTVVNTATNKVYVSNHTGGNPWGRVTVISGTDKIKEVYLSGDLYGISVDSLRNRIYVASISVARVYVIDGRTDTTMGDIQIVRTSDARPMPLRMTAVNPSVITDTHLWLTSSQSDFWGKDQLILLDLPGSNWPLQTPPVLLATPVEPSPEGGLVFDPNPASWRVFASSTASNLVTVSKDNTALCPTPIADTTTRGADAYYAVAHDYTYHKPGR